jgi:riboflavin synthase
MFTGIVSHRARVLSVDVRSAGSILTVERPAEWRLDTGESVSVSGVCLTALEPGAAHLVFDVSPETLRRSTLGALRAGGLVNLERALAAGDRMGGHVVSGHVDATTRILEAREEGEFSTFAFALGEEWARYVVEKGSIALDGISFTVATLRSGSFDVAIIPETLRRTTLGGKSPGALVNVEVDILGKYVERILAAWRDDRGRDDRLRSLLAG